MAENKLKDRFNQVKGEIEHLEVQLALGKAEAVDAFEAQKKALVVKVEEAEHSLKEISEEGAVKIAPLKAKMEELRVQLELGKADSLAAFKNQEAKLSHAIHDFKQQAIKTLDEAEDKGEHKIADALTTVNKKTTDFKSRMEEFRVQLALGEAEAKEEWKGFKDDFQKSAKELADKLEKELDKAEDKAEEVGEKLTERFYDLRRSFMDLFK